MEHRTYGTRLTMTGHKGMNNASTQAVDTAHPYRLPVVLTIAGSDSSAGAGIQADLKTLMACGVYGASAITALTAQNSVGVRRTSVTDPDMLAEQIDAVFQDMRPDAVKIGMVPTGELMDTIVERLTYHHASNIVVDPVAVASSGNRLADERSTQRLRTELLAIATIVTPNIPEAEILAQTAPGHMRDGSSIVEAAERIARQGHGCAVLIKGGHGAGSADDLLLEHGRITWFRHERIANPNTHGTGCTLSSAIAAGLAKNETLETSIRAAKSYLSGCIAAGLDLGAGSGPMDHAWQWHNIRH
jgi:hydroxymethylpyrimidine kinase/phosphomethylpyrimidine kinase